jgi:phosphodiesterase/alkaline phosphatase D-like protein
MRPTLVAFWAWLLFATSVHAEPRLDAMAAGDMTENSVILWARATDDGGPAALRVQVATTPDLAAPVFATQGDTVPENDFTLKVAVSGLQPGTRYIYRFCGTTCDGAPVGSFTTALAPDSRARVRFGFSGDTDGRYRPYPLADDIARRNLDFFVFLGDTMYETAAKGSPETIRLTAGSAVSDVAAGLADYNRKYLENVVGVASNGQPSREGQQGLRAMFAATGHYTLLDNHEVGNRDLQSGGAPFRAAARNTDPDLDANATGTFDNRSLAYRALEKSFHDWHPTRIVVNGTPAAGFSNSGPVVDSPDDPRMHGTPRNWFLQRWGANAVYIQTDTRTYRDVRLGTPDGQDDIGSRADNPRRTMLGRTQMAWLKASLLAAQQAGTTWKFVVISSPIDQVGKPVPIPGSRGSVPGTQDQDGKSWDGGYRAERNELLGFIADNHVGHVVFLTTDDHFVRMTRLQYTRPSGEAALVPGAFQIVTGPIGAGGPDYFPAHACAAIIQATQARNATLRELGEPENGLPAGFMAIDMLERRCGPQDPTPQSADFLIPDQFTYTVVDVGADATLTVETFGIDAYPQNTFPQTPAQVRRLMAFRLQP